MSLAMLSCSWSCAFSSVCCPEAGPYGWNTSGSVPICGGERALTPQRVAFICVSLQETVILQMHQPAGSPRLDRSAEVPGVNTYRLVARPVELSSLSLRLSLQVASCATIVTILIGIPISYVLARKHFRARNPRSSF